MTQSSSDSPAPTFLGLPRNAALSPSRASDFEQCPLLYRFRTIDRLPERPSSAAVRGTLIHQVLEDLYDRPAQERTIDTAIELLGPSWDQILKDDHDLLYAIDTDASFEPGKAEAQVNLDQSQIRAWLDEARPLIESYFTLEDPTRLQPEARELRIEVTLDSGTPLRGIVDRLDVAPDGRTRVVDYKSGKAPRPPWEEKAMFQMRFYALMLWRSQGVIPTRLQLIYLGNSSVLSTDPSQRELEIMESKVNEIWHRITTTAAAGDFQPKESRLCDWCSFRDLCPAKGGVPPALPTNLAS